MHPQISADTPVAADLLLASVRLAISNMYPLHQYHPPRRLPGRLFLRRNGFILSLLAAALLVYIGSKYMRQRLKAISHSIDAQPSSQCAVKLSAAGVSFGHPGLDRSQEGNIWIMQRHAVYTQMAADVRQKGLILGGVITQGLTQDDLFHISTSSADADPSNRLSTGKTVSSTVSIQPVLRSLDIPVRAMILPLLDAVAAATISEAFWRLVMPVVPSGSIWLQDSKLLHATLFHASSHVRPVPADSIEVLDEAERIRTVAGSTCPIHAVLERVLVTSSGVIVACWQATSQGAEPALLRQALARALPRAPPPAAQMVKEPAMLHTTLARLLSPPTGGSMDTQAVVQAVQQLSDTLCGLQAVFSEVWFVEEKDLLALALQGNYIRHPAPLICPPSTGGLAVT